MAKKAYIGVGGVARKIKKGYVGIPKNLLSEPSAMTLSGTSVSNGVISFPVTGAIALIQQVVAAPVAGHKYYARLAYNAPSGLSSTVINVQMWANDYVGGFIYFYSAATFPQQDGQWRTLSAVSEAPSSPASGDWVFRSYVYAGNVACQMKELFLIDLTEIFGAGNEPTKEWCDASIGYSVGTGESVSVARKIKKAYIGIGGVARPCWSGGELTYYGAITPMSVARYAYEAASNGEYAIFAGGDLTSSYSSVVDAYDKSLTRKTATALNSAVTDFAGASMGKYALFGGGKLYTQSKEWSVNYYDTSLTKKMASNLNDAKSLLAATASENFTWFAGGCNSSGASSARSDIDGYNSSLTHTSAYNLSESKFRIIAASIGGKAIFAGGTSSRNRSVATVDVFDTSLTRSTATALYAARSCDSTSATTVGNYAIFGGYSLNTQCDVYDASLTRTNNISFQTARNCTAATTVEGFAIFGGGEDMPVYASVDVFDASLTRTNPSELSVARSANKATTVGNYALFGGGNINGELTATVDAYTVA